MSTLMSNKEAIEKAGKLSKEVKQAILDGLYSGKSIGEIREKLDLDLMVVCAVINENIESHMTLRKEAK